MFGSKTFETSRHYQSQTLLNLNGKLNTDRMINRKHNAVDDVYDGKQKIKKVDFDIGQSSYIESLKRPLY